MATLKYSRQREIVYDTVMKNAIHPTAEQVYLMVKKAEPTISLATVYRNLNLLAENGQLKKICVSDGSDRFDGRIDRHFHAICSQCGRCTDIELPIPDDFEKQVSANSGFTVDAFDLTVKGICAECAARTGAITH